MDSGNYTYHKHSEINPMIGTITTDKHLPNKIHTHTLTPNQQIIQDCLSKYKFNPILRLTYSFHLFCGKISKR